MIHARTLQQIDADYQADLAAVEQHYVEACEKAGLRRREEIAEVTRLRAERLDAAHAEERVFA